MSNADLWRYCTPKLWGDFLLSLRLLGGLGWSPEKELACLYALSNQVERHYRQVRLPKRDGSFRVLDIPDPLLKRVQANILHNILDAIAVSPYATAYRKGTDIRANAAAHVGKPLLLKLDIRDFFGHIHFPMVISSAFPIRWFPPPVRAMLTHLSCYEERLPQGAPTSAAISNLVMRPFDDYMGQWCEQRGVSYTRYCDDMFFSGSFDARAVERKAEGFLRAMGFSLHHGKTRLVTGHQRQAVTGIVVNEKLQVSREYRRGLRQEIYYCLRYGASSHLRRVQSPQSQSEYLASLLGRIQFVLQVNPQDSWFRQAKAKVTCLSSP